ncbi:50S ribosomal protein L17 [Actinomycetota bacterium]|nr:50S ribosomal protein L17 [Actinomycetota bacterium]
MVTPTKGARLGSSPAHERLILANLATSLFEHTRIKTTVVRAKRVQPLAERLITIAKRDTLAARRQLMQTITDKSIVHALLTEIAPQFAEREGGYTRITKTERRKGDQAEMAIIELVSEPLLKKPSAKKAKTETEAPVKNEESQATVDADEAKADALEAEETTTDADVKDEEAVEAAADEVKAEDTAKEEEK